MKDLVVMLRGFERKKEHEQSLLPFPPSIELFEEYHRHHQECPENKSTWQFSRGGNSSLSIRETIFYAAFYTHFWVNEEEGGEGE